jgi:hypothetical protein
MRAECESDPLRLQALNVANGVEQGCVQIFKSMGIIGQSVILANNILRFKPANMSDPTRQKLWSAVDDGVIHIFKTAVELVKVSERYFAYFLKFQQSFGYFFNCYHGKTEEEKQNISLVVSMEYLQKDIREFDEYQKAFTKTVVELEENATRVISKCVHTAIGADSYEKAKNSRKQSKDEWLDTQRKYDEQVTKLEHELHEKWKRKIELAGKCERLKYETAMLEESIKRNNKYIDELNERLKEIEQIEI